jgi:hypothetical protein
MYQPFTTPLTREQADAELARLTADAGRISDALIELTDNSGYKLLDSAPLSGVTAERWHRAAGRIAALWDNYSAYQDVINRAAEIRGRRQRPRAEELAAITRLLRGSSLTLSAKAVALSERTLLGPSTITETATLAETLTRMDADYQVAADFVAEAETAWNTLFQQADPVQDRIKAVAAMIGQIGDRGLSTALAAVADEHAALRREVFADPIGLAGPRSAFARRLARVREGVESLAATAAGAADLRADFDRRAAQLGRLIDRIAEVEDAQRAAEREARDKILVGALPPVSNLCPALRARLAGLGPLRAEGRWRRLAEQAADLEAALQTALDLANRTLQAIAGLIERREELRGRLTAYRVRAARYGAAEDSTLEAYYRAASDLLWTRPCDLAASTRALAAYQKAVRALDGAQGKGGV